MRMKVKIIISKDGTDIKYLHHDAAVFDKMGKKEVKRASDVEFDESRQEWFATLMDGREIYRSTSRKEVLKGEREVIEEMLSRGEAIPNI